MKKGILRNLVRIIFCIICSIFTGFYAMPFLVNTFNKEISGETRQTCIEILDQKTKRIEDTGLTLEELTDEDVDEWTISKSEIDSYYVFKFNKEIYEVSIYFDNEENIVSIQKEYPEGNNIGVFIFHIILGGIAFIASLISIGFSIYLIRESIVENNK